MSLQLKCPRCGSSAELTPGEPTPSSCPKCGGPLASTDGDATLTQTQSLGSYAAQRIAALALDVPGFEVKEEIGRGGMGIVVRARQLSLNREVALKVLPPTLAGDVARLDRFRHEATMAAALTNSHILPLFDILEISGVPVLVLPFIVGQNLARLISNHRASREKLGGAERRAFDQKYLQLVLPLLDQLLEAVAVIHEVKILHRDIKPSNVLIDAHHHLWLADFGLAQLKEENRGIRQESAVG